MTLAVVLMTGIAFAAAAVAMVGAVRPVTPDLADALDGLEGGGSARGPEADLSGAARSDRIGAWLYRRSPLTVTARQRQNLQLRDRTVAEFYGDKAALALVGALLPALLLYLGSVWFGWSILMPALVAPVGLLIGFFAPDLMLRSNAKSVRTDAGDALLTFIDLVTLERLANASATQALQHAAELSDIPLFSQIRMALQRARLEQQPPYGELRKLAAQLDLPELIDIADVMQLDESGAALSATLRARVRELRDAHLAREHQEANAVSEEMTIYMTVPALIFGVILIGAPLMKIVWG